MEEMMIPGVKREGRERRMLEAVEEVRVDKRCVRTGMRGKCCN